MSDTAGHYPRLSGVGAARLAENTPRLVVIGAAGWLGMASLELFHGLLGAAFFDQVVCFGSSARELRLRGGVSVRQHPLNEIDALAPAPSLVLHNAFLTQEKAKSMPREDYVAANRSISSAVLASLDRIGAQGVFLPSSGAVHKVDEPDAQESMRLYGRLKLADEVSFGAWGLDNGHPVAIARVFNLSGPYINKHASYALACFIADALAKRPIMIRADHPVLRSYVAVSELMSVVVGPLTDGTAGPIVFDTAGDDVYEMAQVARVVADVLGHDQGICRSAQQVGDIDRYVGDGLIYASLRGLNEVTPVGFPEQVRQTARYMSDVRGVQRPTEWNSTL